MVVSRVVPPARAMHVRAAVRLMLPREPEPRPPTREDIDAAVKRMNEAIDAGIRKDRPPYTPPETVRGLRFV